MNYQCQVPATSFCAGNEYGSTEMCPGYTGSPVSCEENGVPVLVGLQSFNWVCTERVKWVEKSTKNTV